MENIIVKKEDKLIDIQDRAHVFVFDFIKEGNDQPSLEIKIGRDCIVEYVGVFNRNRRTRLEVGNNSQLNMNCLYLGSGFFNISTILGDSCILNNQVLLSAKREEKMEINDSYIFQGQGSYGRFFVKALSDDKAIVNYFSDVSIKREAIFADARIDMNMALLSPEAKGVMVPGLRVETSKVKAGHGASTFQLSPADLFYLNSRGLDLEGAKSLITSSALHRFAGSIKDEKVKNLIFELLSV